MALSKVISEIPFSIAIFLKSFFQFSNVVELQLNVKVKKKVKKTKQTQINEKDNKEDTNG